MAGLVRNVTDSVGRDGMDSSPRLSHPWTASSFTQENNRQGQGALRSSGILFSGNH